MYERKKMISWCFLTSYLTMFEYSFCPLESVASVFIIKGLLLFDFIDTLLYVPVTPSSIEIFFLRLIRFFLSFFAIGVASLDLPS